ncbi:MAG: hypothetical protein WBA57_01935 [Elainellaceae cyanobacterium]
MTYLKSQSKERDRLHQMKQCLSLAQDVSTHAKAKESYRHLRDRLADDTPEAAELMDLLWTEILSSRRSAMFWEELCNVEKKLTDRMAENNMQLRQNYIRLVQEQ